MYEAKKGSEFGGVEEEYRRMEAWAKKKGVGMWARKSKRMAIGGSGEEEREVNGDTTRSWLARILGRGRWWGTSQEQELPSGKFETPREYKSRMVELERMREKESIKQTGKLSK